MDDERLYSFMLAAAEGIGDVTIFSLLEAFGSPRGIFEAKDEELLKIRGISAKRLKAIAGIKDKKNEVCENVRKWEQAGIKSVFINENDYPTALKELYDAPFVIFYKGALPVATAPTAAIIGARGCTEYGKRQAYTIGKELALEGIQIVSGMAAGADHFGHKGALAGGGYTAGVLGCGVDICYPRTNINTYFEIQSNGCVMSEVLPGTAPVPGLFPRRNRIIAALADVVIIIEARERSGSLITADQALEQGKDVFALPGRIDDPLSYGCLSLIKQGAAPLMGINDILEIESIKRKRAQLSKASKMSEEKNTGKESAATDNVNARKVLRALTDVPKNINRIMYECGLSYEDTALAIIALEMDMCLRSVSAGLYVRA